jgi:hypothetical protein
MSEGRKTCAPQQREFLLISFYICLHLLYIVRQSHLYYTQLKQNKFKFTFDDYILYQMVLKNGGRHGLHAKLVQRPCRPPFFSTI